MKCRKCKSCCWFVNEDENRGFTHIAALKEKCGFCLLRDFFYEVDPEDDACEDFMSAMEVR